MTILDRQAIYPESRNEWLTLRASDITSTEVPAMFGISPYSTEYELWHRKKDKSIIEFEPSERMKWGTRLEKSIAEGIAEDNNWEVAPFKEYMRLPNLRLGASFDYKIKDSLEGEGILEIKNVDGLVFKNEWLPNEDNLEAPLHIEMQVQHQLLISGLHYAVIGALVGGNRVTLTRRTPDPKIHQAILEKSAEFWESIDNNEEPTPDFRRDAKLISQLYSKATEGKVMDAANNLQLLDIVNQYKGWTEAEAKASANKEMLKAQILVMIGDAEKVLGQNFTLSAKVVPEKEITYKRKSYRSFKPYFKKVKDDNNKD